MCGRRAKCRYERKVGPVCANSNSCMMTMDSSGGRAPQGASPSSFPEEEGPRIEILESQCIVCASQDAERVCARCEHARYCSVECQREDWESGRHIDTCYDAHTTDPDELCAEVHCDLQLNRHLLSEGEAQIGALIVELNDHNEALEWLQLNRGHISAGLSTITGAYSEQPQPIGGFKDFFKSKRTKNKESLKAKQKEVTKRERQLAAAKEDLQEAKGRRAKDKQKGKKGLLGKLKTLFRGKKGKEERLEDRPLPPSTPSDE